MSFWRNRDEAPVSTITENPRRAQPADIGNGLLSAVSFRLDPKPPSVERRPFLRPALLLGEHGPFTRRQSLPKRLWKQMRVGSFDLVKYPGNSGAQYDRGMPRTCWPI